jgi:hypothetical protein
MKVAIILGRGIEGCGVTRYALEEQKWYKNNSIECTIYASCDKKWGRKDAQENDIIEFTNSEIKALSQKLNTEYDIVYYQSLPSKKGHSEEYQKLFYDYLICEVYKPIKLSHQNDHKLQSLSRNYNIWEIMSHMDGSFTHSLSSPFAKKMKELNPHVPIMKMGLGFDFESLRKYWKPIDEQKRRVSYFGRFAGFKDPKRIIEMQPLLSQVNILSELRGIERSIGSLDLFYDDLTDRDNSYKKNIYEVKNNETIEQTFEKAYIYGPYNRLEGIQELSSSMFGADFYNLDATAYGDNMEFAMCEIIASGSIALFDSHWAENCKHRNGNKFSDIKDFAIYSDKNNFEATIDEMFELANNHELREKRRTSQFEIASSHCDNNIVYKEMHEKAINCKKTQKVQSTLF